MSEARIFDRPFSHWPEDRLREMLLTARVAELPEARRKMPDHDMHRYLRIGTHWPAQHHAGKSEVVLAVLTAQPRLTDAIANDCNMSCDSAVRWLHRLESMGQAVMIKSPGRMAKWRLA